MKFDLFFIVRIETISLEQFFRYFKQNYFFQNNSDHKTALVHYHLCLLFSRYDLALALNFLYELNQSFPKMRQLDLLCYLETLLEFKDLFSEISFKKITEQHKQVAQLPQFEDLSHQGVVELLSFLLRKQPNTITAQAFKTLYPTAREINSLIETCEEEYFLAQIRNIVLNEDQKFALEINKFSRVFYPIPKPTQFRDSDSLTKSYYRSDRSDFMIGPVFRTFLQNGHFHLAEDLRLSQNSLNRSLLAHYQQLVFPTYKPLYSPQHQQALSAHAVFAMSIFTDYLPLATRANLRALSRAHRQAIPIYPCSAKLLVKLIQLGRDYQDHLFKFRKLNSNHLSICIPSILLLNLALIVLLQANNMLSPILILLFFMGTLYLAKPSGPFNIQDHREVTLRRIQAEQLIILTEKLINTCDTLSWAFTESLHKTELHYFTDELNCTLEGLKCFIPGHEKSAVTEKEFKAIVSNHPQSHLYLTLSNTYLPFFSRSLLQPYRNSLRVAAHENLTKCIIHCTS